MFLERHHSNSRISCVRGSTTPRIMLPKARNSIWVSTASCQRLKSSRHCRARRLPRSTAAPQRRKLQYSLCLFMLTTLSFNKRTIWRVPSSLAFRSCRVCCTHCDKINVAKFLHRNRSDLTLANRDNIKDSPAVACAHLMKYLNPLKSSNLRFFE